MIQDKNDLTDNSEYIPVTVMIFTLNEAVNLPHCLASLNNFDDVIIVDSFSTDNTEEIARKSGAKFFQHQFDGFGNQRNWALNNIDFKYNWVLILDADERVTTDLAKEIDKISQANPDNTGAYRVRRRFYMWGHWLRYSSLYPNWVIRFIHKDRVHYINRGHAETQEVQGKIGNLDSDLIDENHKGIDDWFERQNSYSTEEAEYELLEKNKAFRRIDIFSRDPLIRRAALKRIAMEMPARPLLYFLYSYIFRGGFLDGRDGLIFCFMKSLYQRMIVVKKYDILQRGSHQ